MRTAVYALFLILACPAAAFSAPLLDKHTVTEGFEDGTVGSWASYPPAQDTAYDPTIWVKPLAVEEDAANRALYREITPNYPIAYVFGVREKYDLWVDESRGVLSFRAYVKSAAGVDGLRLRFGFADGTSAEIDLPLRETGTWKRFEVPFTRLPVVDGSKKLDAVAFMAVVPKADPESILRLGLDDVRIDGWRETPFVFTSPAVHDLAEWRDFIAGRYYTEGETLTIAGMPPGDPGRVGITISRAFTGGDERSFTMNRSGGGPFSLDLPLDGGDGPGAGFWRAVISGSSGENEFSTSLVFLVKRADAPQGHPRLFFSAGDEDAILGRASDGHLADVWNGLRDRAAQARRENDPTEFRYNLDAYDETYWLPTFGGYYSAIWTPNGYIRDNALVHALSGDEEAGDAARSGLMSIAEWPSLVHPHILNQGQFSYWPVGIMFTDLALSYDLLHGGMSSAERSKAAAFLYEKGITQVFREYVRDNRVSSNTSNWISDAMGAGLLGCVAVMDEYAPDELEPYLSGCLLKLGRLVEETFDTDGAYGEGALYYSHALHCLTKTMPVMERTFGVRFPEDKIARSHEFLVYQTDAESGRIYDYGDAFENVDLFRPTGYLGFGNFAFLISKYRDPSLAWYYRLNPGMTGRDLIFFDPAVRPEPPEHGLPTAAHFRDAGTAVFRSGFSHDDFVFVFRCGPYYNHHHFDQGSFFLSDRGEEFLTESGRTDYYTDPWYQKLYIQAGGHNCVLVDDNPESQKAGDFLHDVPAWNDHARITDFIRFDGGAFVSGRLETLYKGKLDFLSRSVLYIEPRTVVLIDEAVAGDDAREVNLRFHALHRDEIDVDGSTATVEKRGGSLTIRTISSAPHRAEVRKRPMTLNEFGRADAVTMRARGYLELTGDFPSPGGSRTFVNVMSSDSQVMANLNERLMDGCAVLSLVGVEYTLKTRPGWTISRGGSETDALVLSQRGEAVFAACATYLSNGGSTVFSADAPVTLDIVAGGRTVNWSARSPVSLVLALEAKPRRVLLDGEPLENWRYDNGSGLTVKLPTGSGTLEIR